MNQETENFILALLDFLITYLKNEPKPELKLIEPMQWPGTPGPGHQPFQLPKVENINILDDGHITTNAVSTKEIPASAPDFDGYTIVSHGVAHNE